MADDFERGGSKLYAALARAFADDPLVAEIVGDHRPRWEAPLRLFAGVHYLELAGVIQHPWRSSRGVLEASRDWLTRFVAEQPVQTNEVQRCLGAAARLPRAPATSAPSISSSSGPSAGLEPLLGPIPLPLRRAGVGKRRRAARAVRRGARRAAAGALQPPSRGARADSASTAGRSTSRPTTALACSQAFVWADQAARLERRPPRDRDRPRATRPSLMEGDYVEVLPAAARRAGSRRAHGRLPLGVDRATSGTRSARAARGAARPGGRGGLARLDLVRVSPRGSAGRVRDVRARRADVARRRARPLARLDGHANAVWSGSRDHLGGESAAEARPQARVAPPARQARPLRLRGRGSRRGRARRRARARRGARRRGAARSRRSPAVGRSWSRPRSCAASSSRSAHPARVIAVFRRADLPRGAGRAGRPRALARRRPWERRHARPQLPTRSAPRSSLSRPAAPTRPARRRSALSMGAVFRVPPASFDEAPGPGCGARAARRPSAARPSSTLGERADVRPRRGARRA